MKIKRDLYRVRYSRLFTSLIALSISFCPIVTFSSIFQDRRVRETIISKFNADIKRYSIDEKVVADEIRRIQRTFLNYAGWVPYAKRLKRVDGVCRRDREFIRGSGRAASSAYSRI